MKQMKERIRSLREKSLKAVKKISAERAILVTRFYRECEKKDLPVAVKRAEFFRYFMKNKKVFIGDGERIVGERGPEPGATPTYPEVCLHSLDDLELLHNRPKVSFRSDDEVRRIYAEEIIPYWKGRTQRDRIFGSMEREWLDAYEAGVFTEFQEQRSPGHTVLGDKIYRMGFRDIRRKIKEQMVLLKKDGSAATKEKVAELQAMDIAAEALLIFAERHAQELDRLALGEGDPDRKAELERMSAICRRVPAEKPATFHEALQYYWFVHVGVITELNTWDAFNPGHLDQHLYPFYKKDLKEGTLTREGARELLQAFWIKFNNHPAPPKIGVTARESNTYTDFTLVNVGGLNADGNDAVNELSYLILEVVEEMRILQPGSMVQVSRKNPDQLLLKATDIFATGFGQPSVFNSDAIVEELMRQGKSVEDARKGGASGCVETGAFGTEAYFLTGYFNLTKVLEIALHDGMDPRTGKQTGLQTGDPARFNSYRELYRAFEAQLKHFIDIKIEGNNRIEELYIKWLPAPFLSLLIDDCILNAKDYHAGGARYNTSYIQGVGLGSITDSLTAIKHHVFDEKTLTMVQLLAALDADFKGFWEIRKSMVYDTPKYGNDDDQADDQAKEVFFSFFRMVDGRPTYRGGTFHINMLPTTSHVYFGSLTGAMPDGRKAGEPLSEGISPVQGADHLGPTAVLKSASKIDHIKTGGTLLNQKFSPQLLEKEVGRLAVVKLIRGYFALGGHHIQFNVVSAGTLRDAKRHPERHRDLIVRVAGYSDYFNDLTEELQDEIIRRTEQGMSDPVSSPGSG